MPFTIKNWKLALLAFILIFAFIRLGLWQLQRAEEKETLISTYESRMQGMAINASDLHVHTDLRFYKATIQGEFDNEHTLLLDNKTFKGRIGYEVYTPFRVKGMDEPILVDRGFIPLGKSRAILPTIEVFPKPLSITGLLNVPPTYVALGKILESSNPSWPLRIEFVNLHEIARLLNLPSLYPYILTLSPEHPAAYSIEWQVVTMRPERHRGYAVQWFALALTLLILFVVLNRRPSPSK